MKCKKCGAEIESKLLYCPSCGEAVQLVPDYDVLEEELLSKVVEDKRKAKEDKFASGVYKVKEKEEQPAPVSISTKKKSTLKDKILSIEDKFALKIAVFVGIVVIGACIILPLLGSHTYDRVMNRAIAAETDKKYAKALSLYQEAYEMDETSFEAMYGLGRMYYHIKEYKDAIGLFKKALKIDPDNQKLYSYLLESYDAINDDDSIYKLADSAPNDAIYDLISGYIVLPPTFSHTGGTYDEDIYLDFTTNDNNQVFYTLNGKNPTSAGKLYKKSIKISEGTTEVKAVVRGPEGDYSEIASEKYTIQYGKPGKPVVSPDGGTFTDKTMISIQVPSGAKAYYTWDGTDPTENGTQYTEPFPVIPGSSILSVVIIDSKGNVSPIYRGEFDYHQ